MNWLNAVVRLSGVHVRYSRRSPWVLRDLECEFGAGDTVVVSGRNGAGKSTLLRVLVGQLPLAAGEVVDRPEVIGWMPEQFPAAQPFTARAYLAAMAAVRGVNTVETAAAIESWSKRLGFEFHLATRLSELSKGTARKVAMVQSLLVRPDLLVMDEPWEGLDEAAQSEIPSIVREVTDAGGTVVVTDHQGRSAELAPTRHWKLVDGQVKETVAGEVS